MKSNCSQEQLENSLSLFPPFHIRRIYFCVILQNKAVVDDKQILFLNIINLTFTLILPIKSSISNYVQLRVKFHLSSVIVKSTRNVLH